MLTDVLGYVGNYPNQVIYSHYETGNEILMRNISGKTFYCQRLHNVTNVKSNRVLAVTQMQIIEMAVNPFKTGFGTVLEVYNLEGLSKIKFKKTSLGVLTLTFNSNNVLQYVMTDPISCVDYIKIKMQLIGMKGDLTKSLIHSKHIETATSFFEATKEIEAQFSLKPSYKLIEKIMDLLREATEQFAEGSDDRYLSVIKHIQKFLQREDVTRILDIGPIADPNLIAVDDIRTCEVLSPSATIVEISGVDTCPSAGEGYSVEPSNQVNNKPADDGDFSKYEEELAALMTAGDFTPNDEIDRNIEDNDNSSIDAELNLNSMLGDITEEFTTLINSFEKPTDRSNLS